MPDMNGLEAARRIRKSCLKTEIVILSAHYTNLLVREVVESGAKGYILRSDADKDLVTTVETVSNHRSFFTARASEMLIDRFRILGRAPDAQSLITERLTSRERESIQLLAEGNSSKEVATALGISTKTAETHRSNIMRKLELHSVSELMLYAVRNQIVEP